jgi:hypothetical protein
MMQTAIPEDKPRPSLFEHFVVCGLSPSNAAVSAAQLAGAAAAGGIVKAAPAVLDLLPHVDDVRKALPPQLATVRGDLCTLGAASSSSFQAAQLGHVGPCRSALMPACCTLPKAHHPGGLQTLAVLLAWRC